MDVSTDSFWLELMLWHELERTGVRLGLKEIDDRLTFSAAKACYLNWVKHLVRISDFKITQISRVGRLMKSDSPDFPMVFIDCLFVW